MFSVHVYMSHEDYTKQVPFVTSMIFCHSKQDYITIFHSILEGSTSPPQAQCVVLDYEEAIWRYIRTVMPSFHIKGWAFYFTRARYQHVQQLSISN